MTLNFADCHFHFLKSSDSTKNKKQQKAKLIGSQLYILTLLFTSIVLSAQNGRLFNTFFSVYSLSFCMCQLLSQHFTGITSQQHMRKALLSYDFHFINMETKSERGEAIAQNPETWSGKARMQVQAPLMPPHGLDVNQGK